MVGQTVGKSDSTRVDETVVQTAVPMVAYLGYSKDQMRAVMKDLMTAAMKAVYSVALKVETRVVSMVDYSVGWSA